MHHVTRSIQLEKLDIWHQMRGDYEEWMVSEERDHFSGGQTVRIVNSRNLSEVCQKANMPEDVVRAAWKEALETGDIVFITYYE